MFHLIFVTRTNYLFQEFYNLSAPFVDKQSSRPIENANAIVIGSRKRLECEVYDQANTFHGIPRAPATSQGV